MIKISKKIIVIIFLLLFNGCANLESYLQAGNYKKAKEEALYMADSDVNERLDNGSTHLIEVIKYNKPQLERILLERKANVYKSDAKGFSPLYYAIKTKNINIINPILEKIFIKDKNTNYLQKELKKHPDIKKIFISELSNLIDTDIKYYKIIFIPNLFTENEQKEIFIRIKNKSLLIKKIPNRENKFLTIILNYLIKTKNYSLLNTISQKTFIYDINYSLPKVKNAIQYVNEVEKKQNRKWGYVTNLIYSPTIDSSIFDNFSHALNVGVRKYLTPNNILIGKYNIPTINTDNRLYITQYQKTKNYFIFGVKIKKIGVLGTKEWWRRFDLKYPIINDAKWFDILRLETLDGKVVYSKRKYSKYQPKITVSGRIIPKYKGIIYKKLTPSIEIWKNAKFYYNKFYSLAQISTFKNDGWKSLLPYPTTILPAESILLPHFNTNIERGKFETTLEFKKRKIKINKENYLKLMIFVKKLNKKIKDYKNAKKLFTINNIKKVTNQIKNKILETIFKHKLLNYSYDADKEVYTIKIKVWVPINIGKTFNVDYSIKEDIWTLIDLYKIKCTGSYGNGLKLYLSLYNKYGTKVKFSEWVSGAKDIYLKKFEDEITFVYPDIYKKKFELFDIYSAFSNLNLKNIKNPCLETKILTLKLPIKRNIAPKVKKILTRKDFQPTLIFKIKNNKLILTGIKEIQPFVKEK